MKLTRLLVALVAIFTAVGAAAQSYPDKSIRLIIPFPPGGGGDIIGRLLADGLSKQMGQPLVVDNRPGADQIIGTTLLTQSPGDGYTLMLTGSTMMAHAAYERPLPYNPFTDIVPISQVAIVPIVLVASPALGAKNVAQMLAIARAKPGGLKVGHIGTGSTHYLSFKLVQMIGNVQFLEVPYKGTAPATTALLGNEVDMIFAGIGQAVQLGDSGRAVILGVSGGKRSSAAPQLPTLAESGLPGFDLVAEFYLYAPKGTPAPIMARLNREVRSVLADKAMQGKITGAGFEVETSTQEEALKRHRAYYDLVSKIVKQGNLKWSD